MSNDEFNEDTTRFILEKYSHKYTCLEELSKMNTYDIRSHFSIVLPEGKVDDRALVPLLLYKVIESLEDTGDIFCILKKVNTTATRLKTKINQKAVSQGKTPKHDVPVYSYELHIIGVPSSLDHVKLTDFDFFSIAHLANRSRMIDESLSDELNNASLNVMQQFKNREGPEYIAYKYRVLPVNYLGERYLSHENNQSKENKSP